jgi:hypothetical protein
MGRQFQTKDLSHLLRLLPSFRLARHARLRGILLLLELCDFCVGHICGWEFLYTGRQVSQNAGKRSKLGRPSLVLCVLLLFCGGVRAGFLLR